MASTWNGLKSPSGRGNDVRRPLCSSTRFSPLRYTLLCWYASFAEDPNMPRKGCRSPPGGRHKAENAEPTTCIRRAVWERLYADNGDIVSYVGGRPGEDDNSHRRRFRKKPAGLTVLRQEDGNHDAAAAYTSPGGPHRSSSKKQPKGKEGRQANVVPGRHCQRMRRHNA